LLHREPIESNGSNGKSSIATAEIYPITFDLDENNNILSTEMSTNEYVRLNQEIGSDTEPIHRLPTESVHKSVLCGLCTNSAFDAVRPPKCDHVFCRTCLQQFLTTRTYCPSCVSPSKSKRKGLRKLFQWLNVRRTLNRKLKKRVKIKPNTLIVVSNAEPIQKDSELREEVVKAGSIEGGISNDSKLNEEKTRQLQLLQQRVVTLEKERADRVQKLCDLESECDVSKQVLHLQVQVQRQRQLLMENERRLQVTRNSVQQVQLLAKRMYEGMRDKANMATKIAQQITAIPITSAKDALITSVESPDQFDNQAFDLSSRTTTPIQINHKPLLCNHTTSISLCSN
jgi:hypothetical protein